jgi:hypothetical protein
MRYEIPFAGSAIGCLDLQHGQFCLFDERTRCRFWLVTPERAVAQRLLSAIGERVSLSFELGPLSHLGYVIPRQIQRCPEEYHPPRMVAEIHMDQMDAGLYEGHPEGPGPHLQGYLMQSLPDHPALLFSLCPVDFAVLMARVDDPESSLWLRDTVVTARIEGIKWMDGCMTYPITEILSVQTEAEWNRAQLEASNPLALAPGSELSTSLKAKPRRKAVPTRLRYEIFRRDNHRCVDCGASAHDDPLIRLEVDHRIPVSKGGTNDPENLQTLCWACNNGKSDRVDHKLNAEMDLSDPWSFGQSTFLDHHP